MHHFWGEYEVSYDFTYTFGYMYNDKLFVNVITGCTIEVAG